MRGRRYAGLTARQERQVESRRTREEEGGKGGRVEHRGGKAGRRTEEGKKG
jgi:hypothetical protein